MTISDGRQLAIHVELSRALDLIMSRSEYLANDLEEQKEIIAEIRQQLDRARHLALAVALVPVKHNCMYLVERLEDALEIGGKLNLDSWATGWDSLEDDEFGQEYHRAIGVLRITEPLVIELGHHINAQIKILRDSTTGDELGMHDTDFHALPNNVLFRLIEKWKIETQGESSGSKLRPAGGVDEISRGDLLAMLNIKSSTLNYRIEKMGFPKPRVDGRKHWFDVDAVDSWQKTQKTE